MARPHVVVIGAGMGGLAAAVPLATAGYQVTVLERQASPGGKLREIVVGRAQIDAGPTVFTMRWVFEELFAAAGSNFASHVTLRRADILARHAWDRSAHLDLYADLEQSADAIGRFAGAAEAQGFRNFTARAAKIYHTLEKPFLRSTLPTPYSLVAQAGLREVFGISPFDTLMKSLSRFFADPRLRQLFGRYATYCGSSPYLAPATLMLVAHVERDGVWLVQGGMHALAKAVAQLASQHGVQFRTQAEVATIELQQGKIEAVRLTSGERIATDYVVLNADPATLPAGFFGRDVARAIAPQRRAARSLSAGTWAMQAETSGFPLTRHNVFFSADYPAEFNEILIGQRLPRAPTIYVCAQDRADDENLASGPERLLVLINAPPCGDSHVFSEGEIERCQTRTFEKLSQCGLKITLQHPPVITTPQQFEALFPATGGALYGPAVHGAMATFRRPGSRTKIPGLYLAGGGTHPGAGLPMAALSGKLAAASLIADGASINR